MRGVNITGRSESVEFLLMSERPNVQVGTRSRGETNPKDGDGWAVDERPWKGKGGRRGTRTL